MSGGLPSKPIDGVLGGLAWLGKRGTGAVAGSIFVGMALPQLAEFFRPLLPSAIVGMLILALLRIDFQGVKYRLGRWRSLGLAVLWSMALLPLACGLLLKFTGFAASDPDLALGIYIMVASPPAMAVAGLAAIMRLDYALSVILVMMCTMATPLLSPGIAGLSLGTALPLDAAALALRLGLILAGSSLATMVLRRLAGPAAIRRNDDRINGAYVVILFVFAVASMDGVALAFWERPALAFAILAAVFALALGQIGLTMLVFVRLQGLQAFTIALLTGLRNMGIFVAAFGAALPEKAFLFFAIGQFPIYLLPFLLRSVGGRLSSAIGAAPMVTDIGNDSDSGSGSGRQKE